MPPQREKVAALLAQEQLDKYAGSMAEQGYAFVRDLLVADSEELADLVKAVGMKRPEGRRFSEAVAWRKAAVGEAQQQQPEPEEQPEPEPEPPEPAPEPLSQQEQERATMAATFCGICGIEEAQARELLAGAGWDLQTAVDRFFAEPQPAPAPAPAYHQPAIFAEPAPAPAPVPAPAPAPAPEPQPQPLAEAGAVSAPLCTPTDTPADATLCAQRTLPLWPCTHL